MKIYSAKRSDNNFLDTILGKDIWVRVICEWNNCCAYIRVRDKYFTHKIGWTYEVNILYTYLKDNGPFPLDKLQILMRNTDTIAIDDIKSTFKDVLTTDEIIEFFTEEDY